ncbi:hypothetical protein MMC13_004240 [Lambiella insularis]|nr:hypothetical protein [Lambiella insularis]
MPPSPPPSRSPPSPPDPLLSHLSTLTPLLTRLLATHASAHDAHYVRATALSLTSITLAYRNGDPATFLLHSSYTLPFAPPLASLEDAEPRLRAMDAESRGRGNERGERSATVIAEWRGPRGWKEGISAGVCGVVYALYAASKFPGIGLREWVSGILGEGTGEWALWGLAVLFWGMLLAHMAESAGLMLPRLRKYNVRVGTRCWVAWVAEHLVEGYPAVQRFDRLVGEVEGRGRKGGKGD